ncbi:hypothetical protein ScPMuIL_015611 [Solemya velum]
MNLGTYLSLFHLVSTVCVCDGLKCWKCFGESCEGDPSHTVVAKEMTCGEGAACMKVFYRIHDKAYSYVSQSVVRTCSVGPCEEVSEAHYANCTGNREYGWYGCVIRKCCDNSDLCNNSSRLFISAWAVITQIVLQILLLLFVYVGQ